MMACVDSIRYFRFLPFIMTNASNFRNWLITGQIRVIQMDGRMFCFTFKVRLDVYIGAWNSELALTAPNTGCLDVGEFRIGNHRQYQPVFVSPSPPHPRCRARPLRIRWNCFFLLSLASLSRPTSSPPSAGEAGPPSPLSTGEATPPSPPSASEAHGPPLTSDGEARGPLLPPPVRRAALPLPPAAGRGALPLPPSAGGPRPSSAPWMADLDGLKELRGGELEHGRAAPLSPCRSPTTATSTAARATACAGASPHRCRSAATQSTPSSSSSARSHAAIRRRDGSILNLMTCPSKHDLVFVGSLISI